MDPGWFGRDDERARVETFVTAHDLRLLLLDGEAGIGKTSLWEHGVDVARKADRRVLAFRPGEAERSLTLAGLSGLLPDPVLDEVLPDVPEGRRRALEIGLLRASDKGDAVDATTLGLATASVLRAVATLDPVLIAIDDVQWLDEPTVRILEFAFRRLEDVDVGVLATRRTGATNEGAPLLSAFAERSIERLSLGPLSVGALGRIIRDRLGLSLPRTVATRIHEAADGNPFVALELGRAIVERGRIPGPHEPIPLGGDVAALVADRIDRVSERARDVLLTIAVLRRPAVETIAEAVGRSDTSDAIEELVGAELASVHGTDVQCAHPLVASGAYVSATAERRREVHASAASVVDDVEERARHLALAAAGPDEAVASALDDSAALARRRGASTAAAELAELAVSLTPPERGSDVARRLLRLAEHRMDAGEVAGARDAARRAVDVLPPGPERVDPLVLLGRIEAADLGDAERGNRWLRQALEEAGDDREASVRAHLGASWADELNDPTGELEAEHAEAALALLAGREEEDPAAAAAALTMLAEARFRGGLGLDLSLLDRAVELEPATMPIRERPSTERAIGLGVAGRHRESIVALRDCLAEAERANDWGVRPLLHWCLGWMGWCLGDLRLASEEIELASDLADELGMEVGIVWAIRALVDAASGRTEDARRWASEAVRRGREGFWWWELRGHAAAVFVALTAGDVSAAGDDLEAALAIEARVGHHEPGWDRIEGDLVEALVELGRLDEAEARASRVLAVAETGGHPWSHVVGARSRGIVEAARGRTDEALVWLDRSLEADPGGDLAFERARTLLANGRVLRLRHRRRAAREALTEATLGFEACASPPWEERAHRELAAVSGRVARPTELTETEDRVARLAGAGRTNREIAESLFVSVRTVESHLSTIYRKLGVRSRTELAGALLQDAPTD